MRKLYMVMALVLALTMSTMAGAMADTTVRVAGDTAAGENQPGWLFNRDTSTSTPFEFNFEKSSIGYGALEVLPITNLADDGTTSEPKDKFIGELFLLSDLSALDVSVDYNLGPNSDAQQVYVNVYTTDPTSDETKYYDCRFDFVADGVDTAGVWQTLAFGQDTVANDYVTRTGASARDTATYGSCPSTMGQMPLGSQVRAIAVTFGDTSLTDQGMSVHFDNVVVSGTTYDFEVPLKVKDACKDGGYVNYGFDNQGQCISSLQANENAGK